MACTPKNLVYSNNIDGPGSTSRRAVGACQPPPYVKPLEYQYHFIRTDSAVYKGIYTSFGGYANANACKNWVLIGPCTMENYSSILTQATNKCLDKFYGEMDEQAMLAVNIAERREAVNMMTRRLVQLGRFAKHLRRFDLIAAAKSIGLDPDSGVPIAYRDGKKPKGWRNLKIRGKILSDVWLEFHFGWEPLVKDIFNAIEVVNSPMDEYAIEAKAGLPFDFKLEVGKTEKQVSKAGGFVLVKCGATLRVKDYDAYIASRLGLTNPASWVWELVPFSFVADWFGTLGSVISQMTDLVGVEIVNPWHSKLVTVKTCNYRKTYSTSYVDISSHGVLFRRFTSLPRYELALRPLKLPSMVRAATAIALLTQFLPMKYGK